MRWRQTQASAHGAWSRRWSIARRGGRPQAVNPIHFRGRVARDVRPAPLLGEHSREVFAELLGMTDEEYEALVAAGVSGIEKPV